MSGSISFRRFAPLGALAVLAVAGLGAPASAGGFEVRGTFALDPALPRHIEGTLSGHARPGGAFTGTVSAIQNAAGGGHGENTLDFGGGDTLTYDVRWKYDGETGLLVGTYSVTGGTGALAGATGSGTFIVAPAGNGTGEFYLSGTLSY